MKKQICIRNSNTTIVAEFLQLHYKIFHKALYLLWER